MKRKRRNRGQAASRLDIYEQLFDLVELDDLKAGDKIDIYMDDVFLKSVRVIETDDDEVEFC